MAALLIKQSIGPNCLIPYSTQACNSSKLVTSHFKHKELGSFNSCIFSRRRASRSKGCPFFEKYAAAEAPIPELAPLIKMFIKE